MSEKNNLQIKDYSIIQKASNGNLFRKIVVRDIQNEKEAELFIWENVNNVLWKDFINYESSSKPLKLYNGRIEMYKGLDVVVFGFQDIEKAFEQQKWKLERIQSISLDQAKKMIGQSEGYRCDFHLEKTFAPGWVELREKPEKIKFRYLNGVKFSWSEWFLIT